MSPHEVQRELELELDIAEFLAETPRPRRPMRRNLPRYDERKGWRGGDSRTLYAFIDNRTGNVVVVRPGGQVTDVGPAATVRVATRAEAERLWQSPLHGAWTVA